MSRLKDAVHRRFSSREETVLDTPLPGRTAMWEEREAALGRLLSMVTDEQGVLVEDLPLRCSFGSSSISFALRDLVSSVVILIERTELCHVCINAQEVQDYFDRRQPWETYDYYCVEINGGRCICITHDDNILGYGS